jgi:hypothetical protein
MVFAAFAAAAPAAHSQEFYYGMRGSDCRARGGQITQQTGVPGSDVGTCLVPPRVNSGGGGNISGSGNAGGAGRYGAALGVLGTMRDLLNSGNSGGSDQLNQQGFQIHENARQLHSNGQYQEALGQFQQAAQLFQAAGHQANLNAALANIDSTQRALESQRQSQLIQQQQESERQRREQLARDEDARVRQAMANPFAAGGSAHSDNPFSSGISGSTGPPPQANASSSNPFASGSSSGACSALAGCPDTPARPPVQNRVITPSGEGALGGAPRPAVPGSRPGAAPSAVTTGTTYNVTSAQCAASGGRFTATGRVGSDIGECYVAPQLTLNYVGPQANDRVAAPSAAARPAGPPRTDAEIASFCAGAPNPGACTIATKEARASGVGPYRASAQSAQPQGTPGYTPGTDPNCLPGVNCYDVYRRANSEPAGPTPGYTPGTDPNCLAGVNCYDRTTGRNPAQSGQPQGPARTATQLCADVGAAGPEYEGNNRQSCYARGMSEADCRHIPGSIWHKEDFGRGANVCEFAVPSSPVAAARPPQTATATDQAPEPPLLGVIWIDSNGQGWRFGRDGCYVETTETTDIDHRAVRTVGTRVYNLRKLANDFACPKEIRDMYAAEVARR